eukprot:CAMPEP_0201658364 /NCGR_PEP_ID=MMETSP0494-20130426/1266_1 /ASSEMBLY_ACC=CAM_ASM_000839 /TAXON_ID=420259 /ORGANISM="Thalassiosira gravida, Strain GMp14c1" /LENGTH=38 /DNA_ID= /DNA_START= /DNA_END= /DNA_ORIENTATION=
MGLCVGGCNDWGKWRRAGTKDSGEGAREGYERVSGGGG